MERANRSSFKARIRGFLFFIAFLYLGLLNRLLLNCSTVSRFSTLLPPDFRPILSFFPPFDQILQRRALEELFFSHQALSELPVKAHLPLEADPSPLTKFLWRRVFFPSP